MMMQWMAKMMHRRQRMMKSGNFASGMLVGAMAGAAAGLMFAPKSGRDIRTDIAAMAGQALGGASEKGKQFGQNMKSTAKKVQSEIQGTANQVKQATGTNNNPPA